MTTAAPELRLIVISHEMARELPRTLYSLSPRYQKGIAAAEYEVIVIDNGSRIPPRAEDFADLGLNLRIHSFANPSPSPVRAINHGLSLAKAPLVGVNIDGARLASIHVERRSPMDNPFKIGEVYSNRRGNYEVVHLDDKQGKMVVRYVDSGEEVEHNIETQDRIWQNMAWEEQEAVRRDAAANARYQHGYGEAFTGLTASDFKTNTEGTTWRSRRSLAGQVARLLSANTEYTFVSWSIYRWPVAFLTHREDYQMAAFAMGTRKAKFTIELDEQNIYYGFYIERGFEKNFEPLKPEWDFLYRLPFVILQFIRY